jgi:hypothetical protein
MEHEPPLGLQQSFSHAESPFVQKFVGRFLDGGQQVSGIFTLGAHQQH